MEIFTLLFILVAGWCGRLIFERFRLPPIVGEILAGIIIGPPVLGVVGGVVKGAEVTGLLGKPIFEWTPAMDLLATLGMFFLMFHAGLTTDPKKLWRKTKVFLFIGASGTVLPLVLGFIATWAITGEFWPAILVGVAISGTAMVTKVRTLEDLGALRSDVGYTMMGSSIIDNILSFIVLAVVIKAVTAGAVEAMDIVYIVMVVTIFFLAITALGKWFYPRISGFLSHGEARGFALALTLGLLIAGVGHWIGIHLIIGAYLAGLFIREELLGDAAKELSTRFHTLSHGFLGPVFIVSVAFHVNFNVFATYPLLVTAVAVAALAGKVIGVAVPAYFTGFSKNEALTMGWGMNSRGVVEMILAIVGLEMGILTDVHISVLVFTAILTTLIAPLAMKHYLERSKR